MENRFENNPPEEQQGWGKYATPPPLPGQTHHADKTAEQAVTRQAAVTLCDRVQEMLPALLENDGGIRPEMASALHAHLSGCSGCAREYKAMRQIVSLVETMPPAVLPKDFSAQIMQRIAAETQPYYAAGTAITHTAQTPIQTGIVATVTAVTRKQTLQETRIETQHQTRIETQTAQTCLNVWQRVLMASVFSAMLGFFLSAGWGRQMLGANLETAAAWLGQMAEAVRRVPVLGWIADSAFMALRESGAALESASRMLGADAARGLAFDAAFCAGAAALFAVNRQRAGQSGKWGLK